MGGEDEGLWGSMGGGGVSDKEVRGSPPPPRPTPPPPPSQAATPPPPTPPQKNVRKNGSPSSPAQRTTTRRSPVAKSPNPPSPPPHHHRTAYEGRLRPQTHQPPQVRHPPPPPDQDRHPQGCRKEGRPSRGSDRLDGRPRTLPQLGREGHRPWYPQAEVWCHLGRIPGRHHPLRGGFAPPLPHPRGGRAVPGRGPVGHAKVQTPRPHKRRD